MYQTDVDLAACNTLALPGRAAAYVRVTAADMLAAVEANPRWHGQRRFILGGGSNLVLCGDFAAIMVSPSGA